MPKLSIPASETEVSRLILCNVENLLTWWNYWTNKCEFFGQTKSMSKINSKIVICFWSFRLKNHGNCDVFLIGNTTCTTTCWIIYSQRYNITLDLSFTMFCIRWWSFFTYLSILNLAYMILLFVSWNIVPEMANTLSSIWNIITHMPSTPLF